MTHRRTAHPAWIGGLLTVVLSGCACRTPWDGTAAWSGPDLEHPASASPTAEPTREEIVFAAHQSTESEITLAELEQLAVENNPTLQQARALIDRARGVWRQVGLYPNPVVGYSGDEIGDDDTAGQQGGFIGQTIVTADKLDWNRTVAARDVDRAAWQLEMQRLRVVSDVRREYYEAVGARRIVRRAEELLKLAREAVKASEDALRVGQIPETDKLLTEVEYNQVEILLRNARQREEAARRRLAAIIGVPALPAGALKDELGDAPAPLQWDRELDRLLTASPVLQIARVQVERARARLRREELQPIPNVDLRFGANHDFASHFTLFSTQLGITLPIHDRNQGNIAAAVADLRRSANEVDRIELALQQVLAEAFRRYEQARAQAALYDRSREKAERARRLILEARKFKQFDIFRLLVAQRTLFDVEVRYIEALIELQKAVAEIRGLLLTGGLSDPGNVSIPAVQSGGIGPPPAPRGAD